ncbi:DL-glycerol-3-phosphatase [Ophidiomyces ophidiicola]|nr:DL-glycerol-3-phosphatase [Ophidiomyces ophidiicola]KAI1945996.1 DL-glycerol-3-phosphatase [Ophidiomyces ophidiicola]KAI1960914.1 DL-glycerol-3-phosphatase [Ophidiomyces ophidiicola]KAI1998835.1 DL-glycerol-3-phosphatase [Ophidiomyces ophidiicola]KAI1999831.1 DL-glycerol-3-phosphatase [Ophidiomyces ophidiicola]
MGSLREDSRPHQTHVFDGLLFDFDGTIVDSTAGCYCETLAKVRDTFVLIVSSFSRGSRLGLEIGVDPAVILATSHGRRSIDVLKIYAPEKASWEYVSTAEARIPREYGSDAIEIPGARSVLDALNDVGAPWAVVTSGTRMLFDGWLDVLKLSRPTHVVVAEDVEFGKPHPRCYQLGRSRLGFDDKATMLVIEDAPSGVRAGKAAGCKVLGLATTHESAQLQAAGADWIIQDLRDFKFTRNHDHIEVEIQNLL